ncbi:MAG: hypothetical protein GY765_35895 [bacterium]|nr:hypothetical protein [bacterium]
MTINKRTVMFFLLMMGGMATPVFPHVIPLEYFLEIFLFPAALILIPIVYFIKRLILNKRSTDFEFPGGLILLTSIVECAVLFSLVYLGMKLKKPLSFAHPLFSILVPYLLVVPWLTRMMFNKSMGKHELVFNKVGILFSMLLSLLPPLVIALAFLVPAFQ